MPSTQKPDNPPLSHTPPCWLIPYSCGGLVCWQSDGRQMFQYPWLRKKKTCLLGGWMSLCWGGSSSCCKTRREAATHSVPQEEYSLHYGQGLGFGVCVGRVGDCQQVAGACHGRGPRGLYIRVVVTQTSDAARNIKGGKECQVALL